MEYPFERDKTPIMDILMNMTVHANERDDDESQAMLIKTSAVKQKQKDSSFFLVSQRFSQFSVPRETRGECGHCTKLEKSGSY